MAKDIKEKDRSRFTVNYKEDPAAKAKRDSEKEFCQEICEDAKSLEKLTTYPEYKIYMKYLGNVKDIMLNRLCEVGYKKNSTDKEIIYITPDEIKLRQRQYNVIRDMCELINDKIAFAKECEKKLAAILEQEKEEQSVIQMNAAKVIKENKY